MQDQFPPENCVPPECRSALHGTLTEQQELAASIERDFRSLLDCLGNHQLMAASEIASDIERVKAVVERGIDLSLSLRRMTDA
jgi:hypothetical protein